MAKEILSFNEFLAEMAKDIGKPYSLLDDKLEFRKRYYNDSISWKKYNKFTQIENIETRFNVVNNQTIFYTIDLIEKEVIYICRIFLHKNDSIVPVDYIEQVTANKAKTNKLPKYYSTDFIYDYFKDNNLPLRSSDEQFSGGRDMWIRLVNKAFSDKFYVYFIDNKDIILLDTKEKINNAIDDYFGLGDDFEHKHLLISKKELL